MPVGTLEFGCLRLGFQSGRRTVDLAADVDRDIAVDKVVVGGRDGKYPIGEFGGNALGEFVLVESELVGIHLRSHAVDDEYVAQVDRACEGLVRNLQGDVGYVGCVYVGRVGDVQYWQVD